MESQARARFTLFGLKYCVLASSEEKARQDLLKRRAKKTKWSNTQWAAVDHSFRLKWRPTPYGGDHGGKHSGRKKKLRDSRVLKKPAAKGAERSAKAIARERVLKRPAAIERVRKRCKGPPKKVGTDAEVSGKPSSSCSSSSSSSSTDAEVSDKTRAASAAAIGADQKAIAMGGGGASSGAEVIDNKRAASAADQTTPNKKPTTRVDDHRTSEQTEVGRFEFKPVDRIGQGSYGEVYKVELLNTDVASAIGDGSRTRFCAAKVITVCGHGGTLGPHQQRELDIMTKLTDAAIGASEDCHIVPLIGVCYSHFNVQLLMPLFDVDLWHLVKSGRTRVLANEPDWLRSLGKDILRGLAHIHSERVVHRDLSPANVLVSVGGQPFKTCKNDCKIRAAIGDFGNSCVLQSQCDASAIGDLALKEADDTFTMKSPNLCTYQFKAPEAFVKQGPYSYPSDVWSAGATILFMHLGVVPFGRDRTMKHEQYIIVHAILTHVGHYNGTLAATQELCRRPHQLSKELLRLKNKAAGGLPSTWAKLRGRTFLDLFVHMFSLRATKRPLARALVVHPFFVDDRE